MRISDWSSDVCSSDLAERARIAAESLRPDVQVTDLARQHGITRWQVYHWRKRLREGRLALPESVASAPAFAALMVEEPPQPRPANRSEEHTSELQSLMRISYAVFCLKKKKLLTSHTHIATISNHITSP